MFSFPLFQFIKLVCRMVLLTAFGYFAGLFRCLLHIYAFSCAAMFLCFFGAFTRVPSQVHCLDLSFFERAGMYRSNCLVKNFYIYVSWRGSKSGGCASCTVNAELAAHFSAWIFRLFQIAGSMGFWQSGHCPDVHKWRGSCHRESIFI